MRLGGEQVGEMPKGILNDERNAGLTANEFEAMCADCVTWAGSQCASQPLFSQGRNDYSNHFSELQDSPIPRSAPA